MNVQFTPSLVASCNELCVVHGKSLSTIFAQVIEFISVQVKKNDIERA